MSPIQISPGHVRRVVRSVALAVVLSLATAGCGVFSKGAADLPLPGGADLGSSPYEISAQFTDVLDLVQQSSVKVDNVDIGRVSDITLADDGRAATVTMQVNGSVDLAEGTTARIEQTSLLGEKYVALIPPADASASAPRLENGALIGLTQTSQAVEVEQVLGALSTLLNGGGLGQFQEISQELTAISVGRPEKIRAFLKEVDDFVSVLDERSDSITTALDGLDRLGRTLAADKDKITVALDDLQPGLAVLSDQREQLVGMLKALDRLSGVTVRTLNASSDDIVRDFKLLSPILKQLGKAGSDLPKSLQILLTYPFPDSVLPAIRGDYINAFLHLTLRDTATAQPGYLGPSPLPPNAVAGKSANTASSASGLALLMGLQTDTAEASTTDGAATGFQLDPQTTTSGGAGNGRPHQGGRAGR